VCLEKQNGQFFYAFYHSNLQTFISSNRELQVITDPRFCNYPTELLQNKGYEAVKDRMVGLGLTLTYGTAGPWPEAEAETRSAQD